VSSDGITEEVRQFISEHIASIEQLEVLLLLYRNQGREWNATDVAGALYTTVDSIERKLAALCSSGLLVCRNEADPLYRYKPEKPGIDRTVHGLATAYSERRVSVINLVFAKPLDHIRSFADAFKIKKKDDE
jgi:hypothetical protein